MSCDLRWVMGGMARTRSATPERSSATREMHLARASRPSPGCRVDPRLWTRGGISSTYPACQAVIAACEQGSEAGGRYLRRLREGLMCERKRLDHPEALIAEAGAGRARRAPASRSTCSSNAIVEAFGAQLEEVRRDPRPRRRSRARRPAAPRPVERRHLPVARPSSAPDGERHGVYGWRPLRATTGRRRWRPARRPRRRPACRAPSRCEVDSTGFGRSRRRAARSRAVTGSRRRRRRSRPSSGRARATRVGAATRSRSTRQLDRDCSEETLASRTRR